MKSTREMAVALGYSMAYVHLLAQELGIVKNQRMNRYMFTAADEKALRRRLATPKPQGRPRKVQP